MSRFILGCVITFTFGWQVSIGEAKNPWALIILFWLYGFALSAGH